MYELTPLTKYREAEEKIFKVIIYFHTITLKPRPNTRTPALGAIIQNFEKNNIIPNNNYGISLLDKHLKTVEKIFKELMNFNNIIRACPNTITPGLAKIRKD